jgi:hypothetical protein
MTVGTTIVVEADGARLLLRSEKEVAFARDCS